MPDIRRLTSPTRSTDVVPQVVVACESGNSRATSSPTSKQHDRIAGPITARSGAAPTDAMTSTVCSSTPVRSPRQPAWATPTPPEPTNTTPRQSAVNMAIGTPKLVVTSPSASPNSPGESTTRTSAPCTWTTDAHWVGNLLRSLKRCRLPSRRSPSAAVENAQCCIGDLTLDKVGNVEVVCLGRCTGTERTGSQSTTSPTFSIKPGRDNRDLHVLAESIVEDRTEDDLRF